MADAPKSDTSKDNPFKKAGGRGVPPGLRKGKGGKGKHAWGKGDPAKPRLQRNQGRGR